MSLSPEQERDYIAICQQAAACNGPLSTDLHRRRGEAEQSLLQAHQSWLHSKADAVGWCDLPRDHLVLAAEEAFFHSVYAFDLMNYTSRLRAYAERPVHGYLLDIARAATGLSESAFTIYNPLKRVLEEIQKGPDDPRDGPWDAPDLFERLKEQPEIHKRLTEPNAKNRWTEDRLRNALEEQRRFQRPAALADEEARDAPPPQPHRPTQDEWMQVYQSVCACLSSAQDGQQYLVVFVLHEVEGNQLREIAVWVTAPPPDMPPYWQVIHTQNRLPEEVVPATWEGVQEVFAPPISYDALRQRWSRWDRNLKACYR